MGALLKKYLSLRNYFPTRITSKADLLSLMQSCHPVETGVDLTRIGPSGDGGYLVPDDFEGIEVCYSPGVNMVSGFEKDCAAKGMKVFMADKSVDQPAEQDSKFHFTKKFLGVTSDDDFMTINEWVYSTSQSEDELIIQMDIEGYEYEVLLSLDPSILKRSRMLVVEFHNLDQLWNKAYFQLVKRVFEKILQTHACVHIHPNNCCGIDTMKGLTIPRAMEFTFYRRTRFEERGSVSRYPHPLDEDNGTKAPTMPLPDCWYKK